MVHFEYCKRVLEQEQKMYPCLKPYRIFITRRKGILGTTKFLLNKIFLSYTLLDVGHFEQIRNTIYHEIAHAIDLKLVNYKRKRGGYHGTTWKQLAKKFNIRNEESGLLYDCSIMGSYDAYSKDVVRIMNRMYVEGK
jgi:predicted SprT family Zn-dependent metalloprotease